MTQQQAGLLAAGAVFVTAGVLNVITGRAVLGYRFVRRERDPQMFWFCVGLNGLMAIFMWFGCA